MDGRANNAFTVDVTCFSQAVEFYTNLFAATPTRRPRARQVELKLSHSSTAVFHTGAPFPTAGIIIETPNLDAAIDTIVNVGAVVDLEALEAPNGYKFRDRYGFNWTLRETETVMASAQLCKLCHYGASSGIITAHLLDLCLDPKTLEWMNLHNTLFSSCVKPRLWYSLDKKSTRLENYHTYFHKNRLVEYYSSRYPPHACLAELTKLMMRLIAVLRWAQVAFCVHPILNALAENEPDRYEKAVERYDNLFNRLPRSVQKRENWSNLTELRKQAVDSVTDLLGWLQSMIWSLDDNKAMPANIAMYNVIAQEMMFWEQQASL
ncbi:unnamed protein product [Arabidopsis lyrata]|nr:uncharacterized protein LOC110228738 isoform X2 [Arabidopsis lyrata subsp. lyrata]CAH8267961.1 unnamed protein product [Arabidopsis lyrata]|eukprot:XP_020882565.1 uncharacterized protein LOC110228738 isoform X2 [Arabidopsis lyrata subsp. lyrata]